jgi:hypothetical protein
MTGVITSAPAKSPSHHVIHIDARLDDSAYPARLRLPTPMVALVIVLGPKLIKVNLATPIGVSKVFRPLDHRLIRYPPITPSIVLPKAMAQEVYIEPAVMKFTRSAPVKIAGQIRYRNSRTDAKARPVGGHIGVALGCMEASVRLSFATTK